MLSIITLLIAIISFFFVFYRIIDSDNPWQRSIGSFSFILLIFFLIGFGMHMGKIMFRGTPILFDELPIENNYKIIRIIDDYHALISISDDDILLVKGLPKEIMAMREGEIFEIKNISSVKSDGRFIAPIIHPH